MTKLRAQSMVVGRGMKALIAAMAAAAAVAGGAAQVRAEPAVGRQVSATAPSAAAPSAQSAEPVTPEKLALVRRYLEAIHYERLADQMLSAMLPVVAESTAREHPNITPEQQQEIVTVVREVMREK